MTTPRMALPTRRATDRLARALGTVVSAGDLVVLAGPLGAGKTFLTRALCRSLGLPSSFRVTSPTYALVHEYPTTPLVVHVDLHRLETQRDVQALGLVEQRDDGKLLVVEWGEPHIDVLGGDALVVALERDPRTAAVRGTGPRSRAAADRLSGVLEPTGERR